MDTKEFSTCSQKLQQHGSPFFLFCIGAGAFAIVRFIRGVLLWEEKERMEQIELAEGKTHC